MRKTSLVAVAALVLTGCVSTIKQPIDTNTISAIKGQTVVQTSRVAKPDFFEGTAAKASFALVGAAVAIAEGNKLVAANNIADPADQIAAVLADAMKTHYGVKFSAAPTPVTSNDAAAIAVAASGAARYAIDVRSEGWGISYFPTDWTHYRVNYHVQARLIDTATKAVVAQSFCRYFPENNDNVGAPTYDELVANNAALLKKKLGTIADGCAQSLKKEMFLL